MEDVYISVTFVYDLSHLKLTERVMSGRKNVFRNPFLNKIALVFCCLLAKAVNAVLYL